MSLVASVVVPTYRRPDLLDRCLASLAAQDFPGRYEIVVADDEASPATARQVAGWDGRCSARVRYVATLPAHRGPAAARNRGWRAARGAIIAFTDDDCIPDRGWLHAGVAAITECRSTHREPAAASGRSRSAECGPEILREPGPQSAARGPQPTAPCQPLAGCWGRTVVPLPPDPTDYERDAAGLERAEAITANAFYRREVLELVGGFDERFRAAWREDSDLLFSLLERRARVVSISMAIVVHPVRPARWGVALGQQRKSFYNALLYKKHPRLYRERIQTAPPWDYYATVAAALLAMLGLVRGRRAVAAGAFACWTWRTGCFCARRLEGTRHTPSHLAEMVVTSALIPPLSLYWRLRGAAEFRVPFL